MLNVIRWSDIHDKTAVIESTSMYNVSTNILGYFLRNHDMIYARLRSKFLHIIVTCVLKTSPDALRETVWCCLKDTLDHVKEIAGYCSFAPTTLNHVKDRLG